MSVLSPPEPRHDDPELLIREARARQRKRRLVGVAAVVILAVAVAAYGAVDVLSGGASHAPNSAGAASPSCRAAQLAISYVRKGAVMGEEGGLLRFTNKGRACSISGWPSVLAVRGDGSTVAARRIDRAPMLFATYWVHGPRVPTLTLGHAASGYAILGGFDNPIGRPPRWRCVVARRLLVSPPLSRKRTSLSGLLWTNHAYPPTYLPLCDGGRPFVSPVLPRPALAR
jgi:hypothetical protein